MDEAYQFHNLLFTLFVSVTASSYKCACNCTWISTRAFVDVDIEKSESGLTALQSLTSLQSI